MGLEHRPYVGTWRLNQKKLVQYTPDAMVFINGDTAIPGCPKCHSKIDLREFLTEVSVDAGTQPGSASSTFTLSIPVHHRDSFARDAKFLLRPGLEVHVYMRGYFPVKGLFDGLAEPTLGDVGGATTAPAPAAAPTAASFEHIEDNTPAPQGGTAADGFPTSLDDVDWSKVPKSLIDKWSRGRGFTNPASFPGGVEGDDLRRREVLAYASAEVVERYWKQKFPDAEVRVASHYRTNSDNHASGSAMDFYVTYNNGRNTVPAVQTWGSTRDLMSPSNGRLPNGGSGTYLYVDESDPGADGTLAGATFDPSSPPSQRSTQGGRPLPPGGSSWTHYDYRNSGGYDKGGPPGASWVRVSTNTDDNSEYASDDRALGDPYAYLNGAGFSDVANYVRPNGTWKQDGSLPGVGAGVPNWNQVLGQEAFVEDTRSPSERAQALLDIFQQGVDSLATPGQFEDLTNTTPGATSATPTAPVQDTGPSLLEAAGLGGSGLDQILAYPYYHCFHGVVTRVDHSYSGGVQTVSVSCSSMLHFWGYHNISTNASVFGARPSNSKLKTSMVGHNYTGMHPFEIMYSLYYDMAGAAGGVGYALRDKTNQTATSELSGESLFSLNIKYWEKRFNTRFNRLRMHGATGELFSAAQAHFLANLSSSRLTNLVRDRFLDTNTRKDSSDRILSQAVSLNLFSKSKLEAFLFAQKQRETASSGGGMEINLVEMQAFVSNLGQWGQVNLFESTHETKLDIAQKVTEVTGFEFFQDVDGDFVFKPPFYNLDTSASRVYRIKDIDIISISFSEGEPDVTYMTVKGSHFKNLQGVGVDNEWGVRGQYIDYRLVAQFGWRAQSFETSYFTNPKAMFYAAVNRMDILNIGVRSAQVTIPIRPEIRPGYPVYIEYLDAFYYCPSFAHQFSLGSSCTTALTLVGKRAKFYPPGDPQGVGINAIQLDNPFFPQRPLEIKTPDGPRLAGMPNVVMALDPTQLNPLFSVVGSDLENMAAPGALANLFEMADTLGILKRRTNVTQGNSQFVEYVIEFKDENTGNLVRNVYRLNEDELLPDPTAAKKRQRGGNKSQNATDPDGTINVSRAAINYGNRTDEGSSAVGKGKSEAEQIQSQIEDVTRERTDVEQSTPDATTDPEGYDKALRQIAYLNARLNGFGTTEKGGSAQSPQWINGPLSGVKIPSNLIGGKGDVAKRMELIQKGLLGRLDEVRAEIGLAGQQFENDIRQVDNGGDGVKELLQLMDEVARRFRRKHPEYAKLDSTSNLLDMLSDKKATFSNGTQPGSYRYYSASHPDPAQQGQPLWEYLEPDPDDADARNQPRVRVTSPSLSSPITLRGFLPDEQVAQTVSAGERIPEAALGDIQVFNGIRVVTANPDPSLRRGEVVPTSEIKELMFSSQKVNIARAGNSTFRQVTPANSLQQDALAKLFALFTTESVGDNESLGSLFNIGQDGGAGLWERMRQGVIAANGAAKVAAEASEGRAIPEFPTFEEPQFPFTVRIKADVIATTEPLGPVADRLRENGASARSGNWSPVQVANLAGKALAKSFFNQVGRARLSWLRSLNALGGFKGKGQKPISSKAAAFNALNEGIAASIGVDSVGINTRAVSAAARKATFDVQSPVFPVSDAAGYEVIGSYRYGRDINIDAQSPLDVLHRQDPLGLLSKPLVEAVLRNFVGATGARTATITVPRRRGFSATREEPIDQTFGSAQQVNWDVLRQLDANYTDQDLIDLGLAVRNTSNPSMLDFNMRNWYEDGHKEGINKLPLINAAFSLADLTRHTGTNVCSCKAAEANVFLASMSQEEFVNFAPGSMIPGDSGQVQQDEVTGFLQAEVSRKAVGWEQSNAVLRGQVLDRAGSNLVETFSNAIDAFKAGAETRRQATEDFIAQTGALKDYSEKL